MHQRSTERSNMYLLLTVISITVVAAILRIYRLDALSLWYDEGVSVYKAKQLPFLESFKSIVDANMFLYYFLLHFWMRFFDTDFGIRLLSVIFGVAAVPVTFLIGRTLFSNTIGIIAASFLALSPFHIYYSQDARIYPIFFLFTLLSLLMVVKIIKEDSTKYWIGYVIFSLLLMYSHAIAPFYFLAVNIFYLILAWPHSLSNLKKWVLANCTVVLIYLPRFVVDLLYAGENASEYWAIPPTPARLVWTLVNFTARSIPSPTAILKSQLGISLGFDLPNVVWSTGFIVLFLYSSYIAIRLNRKEVLAFIGFFVTSISGLYIVSIISFPAFIDRVMLPAMIPVPFLVAAPLLFIKDGFHKRVIITMLLVTFSVTGLSYAYSIKYIKKEEWRETAFYFVANQKDGDGIVFNDENGPGKVLFDWYLRENKAYNKAPKIRLPAIKSKEDVGRHIADLDWRRVWLIETHKRVADPDGHVQKWLSTNYSKVKSKKFYRIDVFIYENGYES